MAKFNIKEVPKLRKKIAQELEDMKSDLKERLKTEMSWAIANDIKDPDTYVADVVKGDLILIAEKQGYLNCLNEFNGV